MISAIYSRVLIQNCLLYEAKKLKFDVGPLMLIQRSIFRRQENYTSLFDGFCVINFKNFVLTIFLAKVFLPFLLPTYYELALSAVRIIGTVIPLFCFAKSKFLRLPEKINLFRGQQSKYET